MNPNQERMVRIAQLMGLNPVEACALPAVLERAAKAVNMQVGAYLWYVETRHDVRAYMLEVVRNEQVQAVAKEIAVEAGIAA